MCVVHVLNLAVLVWHRQNLYLPSWLRCMAARRTGVGATSCPGSVHLLGNLRSAHDAPPVHMPYQKWCLMR